MDASGFGYAPIPERPVLRKKHSKMPGGDADAWRSDWGGGNGGWGLGSGFQVLRGMREILHDSVFLIPFLLYMCITLEILTDAKLPASTGGMRFRYSVLGLSGPEMRS